MDPIERLLVEGGKQFEEFVSELVDEWKIMYDLNPALKERYSKTILSHMKTFFDDIRASELQKKNSMIVEIEKCLAEKAQLIKELKTKIEQHYRDDDPLQKIVERLNIDLQEFREMKTDRLSKLEALSTKEQTFCDLMGVPPMVIDSPVPSAEELYELEQHIHELVMMKCDREREFNHNRDRIIDMMSRLETTPTGPFEREVFEPSENFRLTQERLIKVEELVKNYENRVMDATELVGHLERQLERIWVQINYPEQDQRAFKLTYSGIGSSAVSKLREEIGRCEVFKRANMKAVIETTRRAIERLWDQITYTSEQRLQFSAYFTDTYNEDVLELHEMELTRLQDYYEKYEDIFHLALKKDQLCEKTSELAASAKDPNRYKNRGGQLLREEKERKSTELSLAKTTAHLKKVLIEYLEQTGTPFLRYGQDLLSSMEEKEKPVNHRHAATRLAPPTERTPRTKENKQARTMSNKRKYAAQPDQTFSVPSPKFGGNSSIDSGINMKQLSTDSLSSYSQFQEHVDAGSSPAKRAKTPASVLSTPRTPLRAPSRLRTPRRF